jgi:hypothetical protein
MRNSASKAATSLPLRRRWPPAGSGSGHADAVRIRIGREDEVGADLIGGFQREGEGAGVLRVRGGDGRETAVMLALIFDDVRIDAHAAQRRHDHHVARAVHVGVDDLRRVTGDDLGVQHDAGETGEVGVFRRGGHGEHAAEVLLEVGSDVGGADLADFGHDGGVVRGQDLAAVAEAALEAVVVGRIAAGRDDDAGMRAEVPDR